MKDYPVKSRQHKTLQVPILVADIDVGIIPLVTWLNSFYSVITLQSCEGSENDLPYVMFALDAFQHKSELHDILNFFGVSETGTWFLDKGVYIESDCQKGRMHIYTIYFDTIESRDKWIGELSK